MAILRSSGIRRPSARWSRPGCPLEIVGLERRVLLSIDTPLDVRTGDPAIARLLDLVINRSTATNVPLSFSPFSTSTIDLNDDGRLDLVMANENTGGLSVLLGNDDGTFQNPVPVPLGAEAFPTSLVTGDFNGDGRPDLATANFGSNNVSVLLGNGDGTFRNQMTYTVGVGPFAIVTGDFNGDGRPDLVTANFGSNNVSVLLGNNDGTFQNQMTYTAGVGPFAIVAADFNGDGRTDLAVANQGSNSLTVLLGNGDGIFQNQMTYTAGGVFPISLVTEDFNGDGRPDLAVANQGSNDVSVLLGLGDGTFVLEHSFAVGSDPRSVFFGNFNGRPGLLTVNSGSNDLTLISDFTGESPATRTFASGGLDPAAALMFSSGNGFDNLIVANNGDGHVALLEGSVDGLILDPNNIRELLSPTALALSSFTGGQVQVYAATEGSEVATLLTFQLRGETGGMPTVPGLQPLRDAALPLIATLLTLTIETSTAEFNPGAFDGETSGAVSFLTVSTVTVGQSLPDYTSTGETESGDEQEPNEPNEADLPVTQESSSWQPFLMGLDEALDQFCRDSLDQFMSRDETVPDKAQPPHALSTPLNLWQSDHASPEARGTVGTDSNDLPEVNQGQIIDEAIRSVWADESRPVRTDLTPTPVPLTPDRNIPIPAETGPTVPTVSSTEPVQGQEGTLLSSFERGFKALTEFALSLVVAAFVTRGIDPPGTRQCTRRKLEGLYRGVH